MASRLSELPESLVCHLEAPGQPTLEPLLIAELGKHLSTTLDSIKGDSPASKALKQLELINHLLSRCKAPEKETAEGIDASATLSTQGVLKALLPVKQAATTPETGLLSPWLFTASKGSPSLLSELAKELSDCDEVCILVSFITLSGVRRLEEALRRLLGQDRGTRPPVNLRILTTTYTGATEQAAVDKLAKLPNTQVHVSLDGRRTRLHAKAWLFHRQTGFGTAYIGSANFSAAALLGGLEWTVKLTQAGQLDAFEKARANFETLWNDKEFEAYDPNNLEHSKALSRALKREAGTSETTPLYTFFELTPKSYQQTMLDQLAHERAHGRCRNLVVAATGTGKTMIAAFDYQAQCAKKGSSHRPRLLFVAHREEILRQSLSSFRAVLRDQDFGDLLCGGREPESLDYLFASIQSTQSRGLLDSLPSDHWDIVIIDECHHLAAASFTKLVENLKPKFLLGLTATPERSDGEAISRFFDSRPDGGPSCELRLWEALDLQLLAPFEYHVADDPSDYAGIPWNQAGENKALENLIGTDKIRAQAVIDAWIHLVGDPSKSRTLAFCVSVKHAEFMAEALNAVGIRALCLHGLSKDELRKAGPKNLRDGNISVITTCDIYNEGVDLPFVDTILMLRPTQSPVIFQQQLGRGLRIHQGKTSCLILDFVGNTDQDFRFDRLYGAFLGMNRRELIQALENDFAYLPAGCVVQFSRRSRQAVLERLKQLNTNKWKNLSRELATYCHSERTKTPQLAKFIKDQGIDPQDIFREQTPAGWTALKRGVGLPVHPEVSEEVYFGRRLGSLLHLNAQNLIQVAKKMTDAKVDQNSFTLQESLLAQMLSYQVDGTHTQVGAWTDFLHRLRLSPNTCNELRELCAWLESRCLLADTPIQGIEDLPLRLHAHYNIREILTAVGFLTADKRSPFQAGVLALKERKTEILLVTLDKSEALHAAVAYHDYAISSELFHWQSQNTAGPETMAGRRYLESAKNGWTFQLFVRLKRDDPYSALGPVVLQKSEGTKPMSITWKLQCPMPAELYRAFSVLRAA